jgi:hypothetical protein
MVDAPQIVLQCFRCRSELVEESDPTTGKVLPTCERCGGSFVDAFVDPEVLARWRSLGLSEQLEKLLAKAYEVGRDRLIKVKKGSESRS